MFFRSFLVFFGVFWCFLFFFSFFLFINFETGKACVFFQTFFPFLTAGCEGGLEFWI